jgi:hypothetical protein
MWLGVTWDTEKCREKREASDSNIMLHDGRKLEMDEMNQMKKCWRGELTEEFRMHVWT